MIAPSTLNTIVGLILLVLLFTAFFTVTMDCSITAPFTLCDDDD